MIRISIAVLAVAGLSACGGTRYSSQNARVVPPSPPVVQTFDAITGEIRTIPAPVPVASAPVTPAPVAPTPVAAAPVAPATVAPAPVALPFANGPIFRACQAEGRKAASRARCGCIQAVANQSLSRTEQARGAKFFANPGPLQEVRQSDNPRNERFWLAWKAFGQDAAAQCKNS